MIDDIASAGPLAGLQVVEMAGIGPAPFAGMMLADLGADVVRVDRPLAAPADPDSGKDVVNRGKRSMIADLKTDPGRDLVLRLVDRADVLLEGMRPGVMERLGLGPDVCRDRNPRLVYGRVTGWGQTGPLAQVAGHDIDYIAITGALWAIGRTDERPTPPLNLLGDYGGGALFLVVGVLAALLERAQSDIGQVVDAAMVDGTVALTAVFSSMRAAGRWTDERGANLLDTGAPFYDVYECADGRFIAVGAIEPQFYAELVRRSGFRNGQDEASRIRRPSHDEWAMDRADWTALFLSRTRDEWAELLAKSEACVQPVLDWEEATRHPHLRDRGTFSWVEGIVQPAPAPRFSRSVTTIGRRPPLPGEHSDELAAELGP